MTRRYCKNDINLYNYFCVLHITREGVRNVAGVALATPFFRFYLIKIVQKVLKKFVYYRLHQSEIPNALPALSKHSFKIGIDPPPTN